MTKHFVIGAAVAFAWGSAASAQQLKGLMPERKVVTPRARTLDLRISTETGMLPPQPFVGGMIVRSEVAPNATLGFGLANLGRKNSGGSGHSRKPAIKFIMHF